MHIKTLALTAALALPFALPAFAGDNGGFHKHKGHMGEQRAEKLIEALNLDDGRAEEVRQIMQATREQQQALHQKMREEMKTIHTEKQDKLKQVLTEEELTKLQEMRQQRMEKMHGHMRHKRQMSGDSSSAAE